MKCAFDIFFWFPRVLEFIWIILLIYRTFLLQLFKVILYTKLQIISCQNSHFQVYLSFLWIICILLLVRRFYYWVNYCFFLKFQFIVKLLRFLIFFWLEGFRVFYVSFLYCLIHFGIRLILLWQTRFRTLILIHLLLNRSICFCMIRVIFIIILVLRGHRNLICPSIHQFVVFYFKLIFLALIYPILTFRLNFLVLLIFLYVGFVKNPSH